MKKMVWFSLVLWGCGICAAGEDAAAVRQMIRERLEKNPAWRRARGEAAFSLEAEAGFVTDEEAKRRHRAAGKTLQKELAAAQAAGQKTVVIPRGQYRFADNTGLTLTGWQDVNISAEGAYFWFERPMEQLAADPRGLTLQGCRNVTIRGLTIDFDPPVYIQATIRRVSERGEVIEAQIDPAWPKAPVGAGQFSVYTEAGEYVPQDTFRHEGAELIGEDWLRIAVNANSVRDNFDPRLLRYTGGRGRIVPGCVIALNFRRGRSIGVIDCQNVTLEDVSVYQSPGMGILENGGAGGSVYRRLRLIRRPGTRRAHYGTADHFHSNRVSRGAQILECEFAHSSDDNINLHGNWSYVWRQLDPRTVVIGTPEALEAGGRLTFYDRTAMTVQGEATILAVRPLEDEAPAAEIAREQVPQERIAHRGKGQLKVITLDRAVATAAHSLADPHMNHSEGFVIRDCYFHDSRSRAALLSGARGGRVENNVWVNVKGGIDIYEESWGYAEGAIPENIVIRGNTLIDGGGVVPDAGITVGLVPRGQGLRQTWVIRDIRIVGNLIVNGGFVTVLYTDGAVVQNNILVEPLHFLRFTGDWAASREIYGQPGYFPRERYGPVSVWACREMEVAQNRVYLSGSGLPKGVVDMGEQNGDTIVRENGVVEMEGRGRMFRVNRQ